MKKITSILMLILLSMTLSSCSLAEEDSYYDNNVETMTEEDYYIPSGMRFRLISELDPNKILDTEDYFSVSFACEDETVFDNCAAVREGKSIVSGGTHIHVYNETINGEKQATVNELKVDLTFYARKDNAFIIQTILLKENVLGDVIEEEGSFLHFEVGSSITSWYEGKKQDGTVHKIEYTIHFETIDNLELVTLRQFNDKDELIKESQIPQNEIIEYLTLEPETAYYFILEDYRDKDGETYQNRIYRAADEFYAYTYMYTNEDGYLYGDRLLIKD